MRQPHSDNFGSDKNIASILDFCPNMIFINSNGRIVYVNNKSEEIMGYSKEEFLNEDFDFLDLIDPEFRDLAKNNFRKHQNGDEVEPCEYRLITKDGRGLIAIYTTRFIDFDGGRAILGIVTDITEQKELEQKLKNTHNKMRSLFDNSLVGITEADLEGNIIYVNGSLLRMFEFDSLDDMKRFNVLKLYKNPKDRKTFIEKLKKTGSVRNYELEIVTKTGKTRNIIMNADLYEKVISGMIMDITDLMQLQKTLQKTMDNSEYKVFEQTSDLNETNKTNTALKVLLEQIRYKVIERTSDLNETNTALKVLLEQIKLDKSQYEENILSNMKNLIFPYISKLKKSKLTSKELDYLNIIESNLNKIVAPFSAKLSSKHGFTPKEIKIARLIQDGKQDKDIAETLNISFETVKTHRQNIRKKLGLYGNRTNLRSYLMSNV